MNPISGIAPALVVHAITSFVFGLAISALVWTTLKTMRQHNSAARFTMLYSALIAIVALLFFSQPSEGPAFETRHSTTFSLPLEWATYLLYVWCIGAFAGVIRIAAGLWRLRCLRRTFVPLDFPLLRSLLQQRRSLTKRKVEFFHSAEVRVPAAIGFFRPAVVLPSWSLDELSDEELNAAVFHELAHVDRWDDWTNLAQKLIRALLFFHPAVWWLDSRLSIEREMSCDDAVLAQTGVPERYALCLISLAEKSLLRRPMSLVQAAVGRMKQTALRISRILDGKQRNTASAWKPALATIAAFSTLGLAAVVHVPQLISFEPAAQFAAKSNHFSPDVVPAVMHVQTANARVATGMAVSSPTRVRTIRRNPSVSNKSDELFARTSVRRAPVTNATEKYPAQPQFMYVVMETRDYDGSGIVRVTTSVWRLRLPVLVPAGNATLPHAT